jgi:hypothetical protein
MFVIRNELVMIFFCIKSNLLAFKKMQNHSSKPPKGTNLSGSNNSMALPSCMLKIRLLLELSKRMLKLLPFLGENWKNRSPTYHQNSPQSISIAKKVSAPRKY